jgi:CheY-like chemotaxis protein
MKILLIEDDELSAKVMAFQLNQLGHAVSIAVNGEQALMAIDNQSFDALICDLILPDISGVTILQLVKDFHQKKIPTIIISKLENGEKILSQHHVPYHSFLLKPVRAEVISELISKLV